MENRQEELTPREKVVIDEGEDGTLDVILEQLKIMKANRLAAEQKEKAPEGA